MNITLVETNNPTWEFGVYTRNRAIDPITLGYLGAAVKPGNNISLIQHRGESLEQLADEVLSTDPELIGFSCMTFTSNLALALSRLIKAQRPKTIHVGGGYHFSAVGSEPDVQQQLKNSCLDYVVIGEGEVSFKELVNCLKVKSNPQDVEGIAINEKGEFLITPPRQRVEDLDTLAWPIRIRKYMEGGFIKGVLTPTKEQRCPAQVSYTRACTHRCSHCASPRLWGHKVSLRSAKNMLDEIEYLNKEFGTNSIFFTDLTFNFDRQRVIELCQEFEKRNLAMSWYAMCRPDPDEILFRKMKSAGCNRLALGIEALKDTSLEGYRQGTTTRKTIECLSILNEIGISSRGYLMLGFPEENYFYDLDDFVAQNSEVLREYAKAGLDMLRMSFITPFPASDFYDRCKERGLLLTRDFTRFSSNEPIVKHKLKPEELIEARRRLFKNFYESPEYASSIRSKFQRFPQYREPFREYFSELNNVSISVSI